MPGVKYTNVVLAILLAAFSACSDRDGSSPMSLDQAASSRPFEILIPERDAFIRTIATNVEGRAKTEISGVAVNGTDSIIEGQRFRVSRLELEEGPNKIVARGTLADGSEVRDKLTIIADWTVPKIDFSGLPQQGAQVCSFSTADPFYEIFDANPRDENTIVTINGNVTNAPWRFDKAGTYEVVAQTADAAGNSGEARRTFLVSSAPNCVPFASDSHGQATGSTETYFLDLLSRSGGQKLLAVLASDSLWPHVLGFLNTLKDPSVQNFWSGGQDSLPVITDAFRDAVLLTMSRYGIERWLDQSFRALSNEFQTREGLQDVVSLNTLTMEESVALVTADLMPKIQKTSTKGFVSAIGDLGSETFRSGLHIPMLDAMAASERNGLGNTFSKHAGALLRSPYLVQLAKFLARDDARVETVGMVLSGSSLHGPVYNMLMGTSVDDIDRLAESVHAVSTDNEPGVNRPATLERLFRLVSSIQVKNASNVFRPLLLSENGEQSLMERMLISLDRGYRKIECPIWGELHGTPSERFLYKLASTGKLSGNSSILQVLPQVVFCNLTQGEIEEWKALANRAREGNLDAFVAFARSLVRQDKNGNDHVREFLDVNRKLILGGVYTSMRPILSASVQRDVLTRYFDAFSRYPNSAPETFNGLAALLSTRQYSDTRYGRSASSQILTELQGLKSGTSTGVGNVMNRLFRYMEQRPEFARSFFAAYHRVSSNREWVTLSGELFRHWRFTVGGDFALAFARQNKENHYAKWMETSFIEGWFNPFIEVIQAMAIHDTTVESMGAQREFPVLLKSLVQAHIAQGRPLRVLLQKIRAHPEYETLRDEIRLVAIEWAKERTPPAPL